MIMAEWIKCSEKMPKDDESVLVTIELMDGSRFVETGSFYKGDYLSDVADLTLCSKENYKPIAWQPLPKVYKGE